MCNFERKKCAFNHFWLLLSERLLLARHGLSPGHLCFPTQLPGIRQDHEVPGWTLLNTGVQTLSCLLLMVVSFSSWQCPCHLPGTQKVLPEWQPGKQCRDGAEIRTHACPQQQELRDAVWGWCWPTLSEKDYIPVCQRHPLVQCVSLQSWTHTKRIKRAPFCVNLCQWTAYIK